MALDPMAEIRASFFVECDELLESLQDALSVMDEGEHDNETINVVFRAVHSIKGGAGAFGLNELVAFAHRYETVLDELRAGRMEATPDAMKLFFHAADLLQDHVRASRDGDVMPDGAEVVLQELEKMIGGGAGPAPVEEVDDFVPMGLSFDFDDAPSGMLPSPDLDVVHENNTFAERTPWTVTFAPTASLYVSGNESAHILRALAALGTATLQCNQATLPALSALDAEASYLTWTVTLPSNVAREDIEEIFDFVEDVCDRTITNSTTFQEAVVPAVGAPNDCSPQKAQTDRQDALSRIAVSQTERSGDDEQATLKGPRENAEPAAATVRVDLERIDRLVNLVGELVINQAMLAQSVAEAGLPPNSAVMTGLEAFMMLTRDIQDSVMMIRAQPVKPLFQRMARIVRESSAAVNKEVRLKTEGEATEIDKTVIERLADPLTHMIRNAVDHGLESPDKRRAAGKPSEGVITLSAMHRSGRVVIEITDDGAGINRSKVREIAITKGLITADVALSDSEIDNLLFLPGFSTASEISALSGRGVGMDVVKQAITALGGRITITSETGKGTKFSISLPLTLAVLDGMVVNVAGQTLVVPLNSILETATLMAGDIRSLGPETNVVHVRGAFVPLYDLGAELGYRTVQSSYEGGVVLFTAQENGARSALIVDAIMEQRQVVIKGLQQSYGHVPGVAAATILGDGQIALILDPADLVLNATGRTRSTALALAG
jgi:two-component system chemotaxis sensor kinase CheA